MERHPNLQQKQSMILRTCGWVAVIIFVFVSVGLFPGKGAHAAIGDVLSSTRIPAFADGAFPSPRNPPLLNGDRFGSSVTGLGDLDGDGVGDFAVGAPFDDEGGFSKGAVWIIFMNANGTIKSHNKISDPDLISGEFGVLAPGDEFGTSVANLGDLDGNGVTDIAVGAKGHFQTASDQGAVYILFLAASGGVINFHTISHDRAGFPASLDSNDRFGSSVAGVGDLNLDGMADVIVGAPGDDDGGVSGETGAVYIVYLNANGSVKRTLKISDTTVGVNPTLQDFNEFGSSVANLGDVDGNGIPDLAVGAHQDGDGGFGTGAVWVLFLQRSFEGSPIPVLRESVQSVQKISDFDGNFNGELESPDLFGSSVAGLGDMNEDGIPDMAVGAIGDDDGASQTGAVWLLFLNTDGTVKREQKISDLFGGAVPNLEDAENFGWDVSAVGDLDNDGGLELVVGSPLNDADRFGIPEISNAGVVRVLNLDPTPEADLQVTILDSPDPVQTDNVITYDLTVTNLGPNQAETVVLSDSLPLGTTFVNATAGCGFDNSGSDPLVACSFGTLLPQEDRQVQISLQTPGAPLILMNTATVSSSSNDPNSTNDSATASTVVQSPNPLADLSVTMMDSSDPTAIGNFQYNLLVTNHGPDVATDVRVTDILPAGLTLGSALPSNGSCGQGVPVICLLLDMTVGETANVTVTVNAAIGGSYTNTAYVGAEQPDPNFVNNSAEEITTVGTFTKTWRGKNSNQWENPINWLPPGVPVNGQPVFIPITNTNPVLTNPGEAESVVVQAGANLTVNNVLTLGPSGNIQGLGEIGGSGTVVVGGSTCTLAGNLPHVTVTGKCSLIGNTFVSGNLTIDQPGSLERLTVNGHHLSITGNLTVVNSPGGTTGLIMTNPADRVLVEGNVVFTTDQSGATTVGTLTAGELRVMGHFSQTHNAGGSIPFAATGLKVIFQGLSPQTVSFSQPGSTASHFDHVDTASSSHVILASDVSVAGSFSNSGTLHIPVGTTLTAAQGVSNEAGGVIETSGTVVGDVTNAGFLAPGNSPGTFVVNGNLTLASTSTLSMELGGFQAGVESDLVSVTGDVTVNGTLLFERVNGFTPVLNDTVEVLSGNSIAGAFHTTHSAQVQNDLALVPIVGSTDIQALTQTVPVTQFDLVITTNGLGNGLVTSLPRGIECGNGQTFCHATFPAGTVVELFAQPNGAGVTFGGWGGPGCAGVQDVRCTVSMTQTRHITSTFSSNTFPAFWQFFPWKPFGPTVMSLGFGQAAANWGPDQDQDANLLAHYNLYVSTESGNYQGVTPINVGTNTAHTLTGLTLGVTYFAVVTGVFNEPPSGLTGTSALLAGQQESAVSEEVRFEATGGLIGWTVIDTGTPPSSWQAINEEVNNGIEQTIPTAQNLLEPDSALPKLGTLLTHPLADCRPDFRMNLQFRSNDLNEAGAMGVVFRVNGPQTFYRFTVDWELGQDSPRFRLVKRQGTEVSFLTDVLTGADTEKVDAGGDMFFDGEGPGAMTQKSLEVILEGPRIQVRVGGLTVFDATDTHNPIETGAAFGFSNWRTIGSRFTVPTIPLVEYGETVANQNCAVLEVQQIGTGEGTVSTASVQPPAGAALPIAEIGIPGSPGVTYPVGTVVVLTAAEDQGFSFDGWDGPTACQLVSPTNLSVNVTENLQCQVKFGGSSAPAVTLDIDGNGVTDQIDAAVLQRGLFGLEGAALMEPIVACDNPDSDRCGDPLAIKAYIEAGRSTVFDPDGNGQASPTADANLIARYVAWKQGGEVGDMTELIRGVVDPTSGGRVIPNDEQATAQAIVTFLNRYYLNGQQAVAAVGSAIQGVESTGEAAGTMEEQGLREVSTEVRLGVSHDSTVMAHQPHRNVGAQPVLQVGGKQPHHAVVQFTLPKLLPEQVISAQLVLTPYQGRVKGTRRSLSHPSLEVVPLREAFVEGNGQGGRGKQARGTGAGVTWACAVDANIRNTKADCAQTWLGGFSMANQDIARLPMAFDEATQQYSTNVMRWIREAILRQGSLLSLGVLPANPEQVLLYSKEGAADNDIGKTRIPSLLIELKE